MNGREFFPRAANAQSAQNTNVYVLRRNKMKMKDRVVLQTLRTAIHVLDTAAKVFAGASDDLTEYKRQILAKTGDK
jgi:hypothetical protein